MLVGFLVYMVSRESTAPAHAPVLDERGIVLSRPADVEKENYDAIVARLAVSTSTLTIGRGCAMDPLVLRFQENATTTILNNDAVPHTIEFEDGGIFILAPNYAKQLVITSVFGKSKGIHRYRCDDISDSQNVGVLYITE